MYNTHWASHITWISWNLTYSSRIFRSFTYIVLPPFYINLAKPTVVNEFSWLMIRFHELWCNEWELVAKIGLATREVPNPNPCRTRTEPKTFPEPEPNPKLFPNPNSCLNPNPIVRVVFIQHIVKLPPISCQNESFSPYNVRVRRL